MSDERESEGGKRERSGVLTVAVIVLLVLPAIYLFSTGPVAALRHHGILSEKAFQSILIIYWPIIYLEQHSEWFAYMLRLWTDLWE